MIRPKNETEGIIRSKTKTCEALVKQAHMKPQEALEFKLTKRKENILFKQPSSIDGSCMVRLTGLEVYSSIFNITEENIRFELSTDLVDEFPFNELKDEIEEILCLSDITPEQLQHDIVGPREIKAYEQLRSEITSTDGYLIFLRGYARPLFPDFESYLRNLDGLDEKK